MRSKPLLAVGLSVAALALPIAFAGTAAADGVPGPGAAGGSVAAPTVPAGTCFKNLNGQTSVGYTSQNFEEAYDAYDSEAADDLRLGSGCRIRSMHVSGVYYTGSGPVDSMNIRFYKDENGVPKTQPFIERLGVPTEADDQGTLDFNISPAVKLSKKTTYWISVQANMDFATRGQWGWEATTDQKRDPAAWRNEGGGFGFPGCEQWANMQTCLSAEGPDLVFSISDQRYHPER